MKKYLVTAEVTISIHTEVEANSEKEAKKIAMDRGMVSLCYQCSGGSESEEWCTSGELDGEPRNLRIDE